MVLHDGEIVVLRPDEVTVFDVDGFPHAPASTEVDWDEDRCEKDGFETFMLKEIHEQGAPIAETLSQLARQPRLPASTHALCGRAPARRRAGSSIVALRNLISRRARRAARDRAMGADPGRGRVASEFRYREPIVGPDTLVLGITQSGETADTLAAMRLARERGATVIAVTNVAGSQATREADAVLFTRAGIEMGVAATKTFVSQVVLLYALALRLAGSSGTLSAERG